MEWEVNGAAMADLLVRLQKEYNPKAIYITENGASYSTGPDENGNVPDVNRTNYLKSHFAAAHRAMQAGVPLAGYFVWSLMDNFEWAFGFEQRFGIVWVNFEAQERILKDSAKWYRTVIRKNGF